MTRLTRRERQMMLLLANGRTIASASAEMGISRQTGKNLVYTAYKRLGVDRRYDAFLELGWLTPPDIEGERE